MHSFIHSFFIEGEADQADARGRRAREGVEGGQGEGGGAAAAGREEAGKALARQASWRHLLHSGLA